ncbi:MAG TPA: hypothetical protein VIW24_32560 [Aldersonia sp.]
MTAAAGAAPAHWQATAEGLLLSVGSCAACGYCFYPPQDYGCERCGAPGQDLSTILVPAEGRLEAIAAVVRPDFSVNVGQVRLGAADVVVRAPVADGTVVGDRVRGRVDEQTPPVVLAVTGGRQ